MTVSQHGGFGAFSNGFTRGVNIIHDEVVSINFTTKKLLLSSGGSFDFECLISAIPLDQLISLVIDVPRDVQKDAASS